MSKIMNRLLAKRMPEWWIKRTALANTLQQQANMFGFDIGIGFRYNHVELSQKAAAELVLEDSEPRIGVGDLDEGLRIFIGKLQIANKELQVVIALFLGYMNFLLFLFLFIFFLGYMNADICNEMLSLLRVSRSTSFAHFCTALTSRICGYPVQK